MISDTVPLWSIIVFIAIIAVTAYITAIERALSSVNKTRIREMEEESSPAHQDHRRSRQLYAGFPGNCCGPVCMRFGDRLLLFYYADPKGSEFPGYAGRRRF